jgi:hypothetical protein
VSRAIDPKLEHLISEAESHPLGVHKTALLEQAIGRADALGDDDRSWSLRHELMASAVYHGSVDRLMVAMATCIAMSDADPVRHPAEDILWQLKWMAADLPDLASVPRAVIEGLFEEVEARYRAEGWGMRGVYHQRAKAAMVLGDIDQVRGLLKRWREQARDRGSDCRACEQSLMVHCAVALGDVGFALREATPLIDGKMGCQHVPHTTFADMLLPLRGAGKLELARDLCRRGLRLVRGKDGFTQPCSQYAHFSALDGDLETALSLLAAKAGGLFREAGDYARMLGYAHWSATLAVLHRAGETRVDGVRPRDEPLPREGTQRSDELSAWMGERARGSARQFDGRNGNSSLSGRVESVIAVTG